MTTRVFLMVIVGVWASPPVAGQDIIHYKFESGGGSSEINYAGPTPGIPQLAQIVTQPPMTPNQAWGPGRFGGGLSAGLADQFHGPEIDTGWDGVLGPGVDFTIALFLRAVYPIPSNNFVTLCSAPGNGPTVRLQVSSVPGTFGQPYFNWSAAGSGQQMNLPMDVVTPAFSNWVHLAIVVNRTQGGSCQNATVQWFVNGVGQIPQAPGGCFNDIAGTSLATVRIGQKNAAFFRFDDVRISLRAVPAAEILQWATTDLAADAPYGDACYPFGLPVLLNGSGGNPTPGNSAYMLTVYGLPASNVYLGFGLSDTSWGATPLPLDLAIVNPGLAGCLFRASPDSLVTGTIGAAGSLAFPFPIPTSPSPLGANAYAQAILYSPVTGLWSSTNAWAVHVGN